jgi:hypothetical protein
MTKTQKRATRKNSVEKKEEYCLEKVNKRKKVKISKTIKDNKRREEWRKNTRRRRNQTKSKANLRIN